MSRNETQNLTVLLSLLLSTAPISGQGIYPADTILNSNEVSMLRKTLIVPISLWQRLSYNLPFIRCQYYPSCSNYAAGSISEHGVFLGTAMASDRLVRCNPFAYHYHLSGTHAPFHPDGRIVDSVPDFPLVLKENRNKSPWIASGLSIVIPGAGRIYAGRFWDGVFGFTMVALSANATRLNYERERNVQMAILGLATLAFYSGEIWGAYKAAGERGRIW